MTIGESIAHTAPRFNRPWRFVKSVPSLEFLPVLTEEVERNVIAARDMHRLELRRGADVEDARSAIDVLLEKCDFVVLATLDLRIDWP